MDPIHTHRIATWILALAPLAAGAAPPQGNPASRAAETYHVNDPGPPPRLAAIQRANERLEELGSGSPTDVAWIVDSNYWNPSAVKPNAPAQDELRRLLAIGQRQLDDRRKIFDRKIRALLEEAIEAKTTLAWPAGAALPADTRELFSIGRRPATGKGVRAVFKRDNPDASETWDSIVRYFTFRRDFHDAIRAFVKNAPTAPPKPGPEEPKRINNPNFTIEILDQYWQGVGEYCAASHGHLRITIGGRKVLPFDENEGKEECGVATSAFALLKTIDRDHNPKNRVAQSLVLHGCSDVDMRDCPIGADWTVEHVGDNVILRDVVIRSNVKVREEIAIPGLEVTVPLKDYRAQILALADGVKSFAATVRKDIQDPKEREKYDAFWREFDAMASTQRAVR